MMRSFGIGGAGIDLAAHADAGLQTTTVDGIPVSCGIVTGPAPRFDGGAAAHVDAVMVRVHAFSCNYRDKYRILAMATRGPADRYHVVGSEFVGEVIAVGSEVHHVAVGDRVIGDNHWPSGRSPSPRAGVPSNHASREYLILKGHKVAAIPRTMSAEVGAAFSIGAQTAYSMLAKLDVRAGHHVLITAGSANTSLFAINAVRRTGAHVYVTTSAPHRVPALRRLGVDAVLCVDPALPDLGPEAAALARSIAGFDAVLDPFFDLHLTKVLPLMASGGRYTTCGFYDQYLELLDRGPAPPRPDYTTALQTAMINNITIIGNCVGVTADLERALRDHAAGAFDVVIDSVFQDGAPAAFLGRTYDARDRFGKVVFIYA
jgi:NADPH:quinone reductase-like Zn-dependent oxidoreductase